MSPERYPLHHSATPNQKLGQIFFFKKEKKLPRPGIEPGSLWPQHSILTVRPPKHLFFLLPIFYRVIGIGYPWNWKNTC